MAPHLHAERGNGTAKRLLLVTASAFVTVNVWTGAPLIALWAGSVVVHEQQLTMAALAVVVIVLAVVVLLLAYALVWLNGAYEEASGAPRRERRSTWLRSMNSQGEDDRGATTTNVIERIVILIVYVAVTALVVWLVFFAGSMLPNTFRD